MKRVLELLERDARMKPSVIAVQLGVREEEVLSIIAEAEKKGIIRKYKAVVNWNQLEDRPLQALIEVRVSPERGKGFEAVASRIYRYPEVKSVFLMSGAYDFAVLVEGASMREVAFFVAEKLSTLDNVLSTSTHFILKKYKEDGDILDDEESAERLAVTP